MSCPGAARCPYRSVAVIGQRAEGVLREPEAVALDGRGHVYVGDQFGFAVQRFSTSGRYEGEFGAYGHGPGQFGAVDGVAVDGRGAVYVLDSSGDRVEKFSPAGRLIGEWGSPGSAPGQFRFGGGAGPGSPPGGDIAVYGEHVYVSDTGNGRIERFDLSGGGVTVWRPQAATFTPRGLAVTARRVYVGDEGARQILALDHQGHVLAHAGRFGTGLGEFSDPFGVAVDARGQLFVADNNNNRVVVLSSALTALRSFRGRGSARLSYTRALASDAAGRLFVADTAHNRIEVFDSRGTLLGRWGSPAHSAAQLVAPLAVAADPRGGPLVVSTFGSRSPIFHFDSALRLRSVWERGGGAILGRHFFAPTAVAVAGDGTVWVTDRGNGLVRHLSASGRFLGALGTPARPLGSPSGVAVDARGEVYVSDASGGRVERFAPSGRPLGIIGARVGLSDPQGVAVDRLGRVLVTDTAHGRVLVFTRRGRQIARWGAGRLRSPTGIAVDGAGRTFVADAGAERVVVFDSRGRPASAWGTPGTGTGQFSGLGGIAVDCRGALLVADTHNNRVQVFAGVAAPGRCS